MINEETIFENRQQSNGQKKQSENNAWVNVTLGGVSGILMGAGLMYAGMAHAKGTPGEVPAANPQPEAEIVTGKPEGEVQAPQPAGGQEQLAQQDTNTNETIEVHHHYHYDVDTVYVTEVDTDLSFGEAFAAARAEVGPGGVFVWHGGVYNTFTAEEWNSMTPAQKNDFASHVHVHTHVDNIVIPTDDHIDVVLIPGAEDVVVVPAGEDVVVVDQQTADNFDFSDDVHVVGYADVDGHLAVGYDSTNDGQADVVIIDVDDNHCISNPDLVFDDEGNVSTVSDIADTVDDTAMDMFDA